MSWNSKENETKASAAPAAEEKCECARCVARAAGATELEAERAAYEDCKGTLNEVIDRSGYAVTIGGMTNDDPSVREVFPFIYSIGLSAAGVRELIAFGMVPPHVFDALTNRYMAEVIAGTLPRHEPVEVTDWFGPELPVMLVPVDRKLLDEKVVQMADIHFEGTMFQDVEFTQVVFRDSAKKYPWEEGAVGADEDGWFQPVFGPHTKSDTEAK